METLHNIVFWANIAWQSILLAAVMYLGIWLFTALEVVI